MGASIGRRLIFWFKSKFEKKSNQNIQSTEQNNDQKQQEQQYQNKSQQHQIQQEQQQQNQLQYEQQQRLQQQQIIIQKDKQMEQQIQYYVYEDLSNFLEALFVLEATLLYFKNQPNHPYIPIALNQFIIQTNLSKTIHFDCNQRFRNKSEDKLYQTEKQNALVIYKEIKKQLKQINENQIVKECLTSFEQNFDKNVPLQLVQEVETQQQAEFNSKVIENVIGGIQHQSRKQDQIQKGEYEKLGKQQIKENIKQRQQYAKQQLQRNFSNIIQDQTESNREHFLRDYY